MATKLNTAERVSASDKSDNFVFQRSLLAYYEAAKLVSGDVLEIGTGNGYGIEIIAPISRTFITVDKHIPATICDMPDATNVEFYVENVPPLTNIASCSCDFVISFQVIEHIKDDFAFLGEVLRVLRRGGKFIVSTPNRLMSLTRNPWHVREYSPEEFSNLLGSHFINVEALGVTGNAKVMDYYEANKESVAKFKRIDILNLQDSLPRWMLRIPYDIANRYNRRKLLNQNSDLTTSIQMSDYSIVPISDQCFDLFYIAEKE